MKKISKFKWRYHKQCDQICRNFATTEVFGNFLMVFQYLAKLSPYFGKLWCCKGNTESSCLVTLIARSSFTSHTNTNLVSLSQQLTSNGLAKNSDKHQVFLVFLQGKCNNLLWLKPYPKPGYFQHVGGLQAVGWGKVHELW